MKLVSDFDGIWTDQDKEAAYVWNYIVNKISGITDFSAEEVNELLEGCKKGMDKTPWEYGWFNNGEISAYYREDPFGDNNAVFNFIHRAASESSHSVFRQKLFDIKKAIIKNGFESAEKFSNTCFMESTRLFKESGKLTPHPNAKKALESVLKKGVNIVVASNSSTEKIEHLFLKLGKQPTNERSFKPGNVHARGNSMKFVLTPDFADVTQTMSITGKYKVQLRRKSYYELLVDESPDYVIGDVFSLDIALPLYLRLKDSRFINLKVIQKVQKHTPEWVKDFLSADEFKDIVYMIDDISELADVIKW